MSRIVSIAGSGRGSGKTAVGCALIEALPAFRWTAVKVTPHDHEVQDGAEAGSGIVHEETDPDCGKDTSRYLAAGAARALLVSGGQGAVAGSIREVLAEAGPGREAMLLECGLDLDLDLMWPGTKTLHLLALGADSKEWKPPTRRRIATAGTLIVPESLSPDEFIFHLVPGSQTRMFWLPAGRWMTPHLLEFVHDFLLARRQPAGRGSPVTQKFLR